MLRCASCDIELSGQPVTANGRRYCCLGCADGGPCVCTYERDAGRYPRNGHATHEVLRETLGPSAGPLA